jgi:hypothetical protein
MYTIIRMKQDGRGRARGTVFVPYPLPGAPPWELRKGRMKEEAAATCKHSGCGAKCYLDPSSRTFVIATVESSMWTVVDST